MLFLIRAARIASSGEGARSMALLFVGLRRARYVGRFIYWTVRHRSTSNAAWLCAYEGFKW